MALLALLLSLLAASGLLPINRDFYELSAKTGGDFYFWAPGEFAASRLVVPVEEEEVVLAYGSVDGRRVFEVPVEGGARALTLFAGVQRKDLATVVRPDGSVAAHGQPGVIIQTFQHMAIATIASPAAGMWRLELDGAGTSAVTAHLRPAAAGIQLIGAGFVEQRGRPGHEGWFPLEQALPAGAAVVCRVRMSGTVRDVRLAFFRRDGTALTSVPMKDAGDGEYLAPCEVPGEPFRLGVAGADAEGRAFRRMERPLREPLP